MPVTHWTPRDDCTEVFARLSGDCNPVHLDDDFAKAAGFPSVIVHGMCVLGASARAAHREAGSGTRLHKIDVRFAKPVLPGQVVSYEGTGKETPLGLRINLGATLADGTRIMSPANFTFASGEDVPDLPKGVDPTPAEDDVVGDPYGLSVADLGAYCSITGPEIAVEGEGVPPMACLLGMTGALEKAFRGIEPEKPGTWVHLRQQGVFYMPVEVDTPYRCRIQAGRTVVRHSAVGSHVTIPFVVEIPEDSTLVSTGACVLLYAFDREEG